VLTSDDIIGDQSRVSVSLEKLPQAVKTGDKLFINDGLIHLEVISVKDRDIICNVLVGGELRSRKGLNLPGIDLGISAFTDHDQACLTFALEHGVDAVSQSFVASAADIEAVRQYAKQAGYSPFIIAKIERTQALQNIDEILNVTDGIMVARGDLGVEIPIEQIAVTQKQLMQKANEHGKPVITATHMLESMVEHRRPTRAEATDVANAILDGTDSVMLSGESAMGKYPVEAAAMLAKIAMATEPNRPQYRTRQTLRQIPDNTSKVNLVELIALSVQYTLDRIQPAAILVPTLSGDTARNITRFRLPVWITAFSPNEATCQSLQFSYGVNPVLVEKDLPDWDGFCKEWLQSQGFTTGLALLTQGPSELNPSGNHRMEILEL
jgi:pyruvate kinase